MDDDDVKREMAQNILGEEYYIVRKKKGNKSGYKHSPEVRKKISVALTGKQKSEETKRKISESQKYGMIDRLKVLEEEVESLRADMMRNARMRQNAYDRGLQLPPSAREDE